jgi:hypothetical protein
LSYLMITDDQVGRSYKLKEAPGRIPGGAADRPVLTTPGTSNRP